MARPPKRRRLDQTSSSTSSSRQRAGFCTNPDEAFKVLVALAGTWRDSHGSIYTVTKRQNLRFPSLNVETKRPDAKGEPSVFKDTQSLIRVVSIESMSSFFQIVWGRAIVFFGFHVFCIRFPWFS